MDTASGGLLNPELAQWLIQSSYLVTAFLFIMGMFASGILTALIIYRKNY